MRKSLSAALVALVAGAVVPGVAQAAPGTAPVGGPRWGPCPADAALPGLRCSTVRVPLDYAHPRGATIDIAISRLVSAKPGKRRGVLLTNNGGPGGIGLFLPGALAAMHLPQSVRDSYDVIGFDPRGVGHSAPVTCGLRPEQQFGNIPPFARGPVDVLTRGLAAHEIAGQCARSRTAPTARFVNTANTARDMDRIRAALGEQRTSYFGYSYGTYLGAVYTTLFPGRSDRIVLDSALGPHGFDSTAMRRFGRGFQERFPDFARFVAAHPQYHLGTTPAAVTRTYYALAAKLDAKPTAQGFDGALFRQITLSGLYLDSDFPGLADKWRHIATNTPIPAGTGKTPDPAAVENGIASQLTVLCNDSRWPRSILTYERNVAVDRFRYPMFGAAASNVNPCAFWPTPVEPPVRIGDRGPSDVLIVQNRRDPATPLVGARELRGAFGDRARMVTADQGGHQIYLYGASTCANDAVTTFLVTGKRPARDLACPAPNGTGR